jgi:uncharacterized hydantoinase/oxoprolinase family protein
MRCADLETSTAREREELATHANLRLISRQAFALRQVIKRLPSPVGMVITSGSGEFLIPMIFLCPTEPTVQGLPTMSLAQKLGREISAAACAWAVAVLCAEEGM